MHEWYVRVVRVATGLSHRATSFFKRMVVRTVEQRCATLSKEEMVARTVEQMSPALSREGEDGSKVFHVRGTGQAVRCLRVGGVVRV
jgi:hypothetical protein